VCQIALWLNKPNADELLTIFSLCKQMRLARIDANIRVREVLAKKQLDELKQWYHSLRLCACGGGATPAAGPGHMHGGMMGK
jgi:hypothetical protein